eukprot:gene13703-15130_t
MSAELRKRGLKSDENTEINSFSYVDANINRPPEVKPKRLSLSEVLFLIFAILGLIFIAVWPHFYLPAPKFQKEEKEWSFTSEKARGYLEGLTDIGHRTVGSYRNDILAVNYLMKEIYGIISHAHIHYNFNVEIQTASGGYSLHFLHKYFSVAYNNVTNVIVNMYPKDPRNSSNINVMLNAHFDTQPRTEGASDDAVSCAIMLETMRAISRSPPGTIKHGIIFLFNGAEEGLLDGSHAFVTKQKLAKTIKAFVNLEAAGSGGREVVFQTGPGHPWLIYEYASSAKYPYASVLAQEIFQSGVIPSDTDFRIFRDFGNLVGIDIAYASNGYVYHTRYDHAKAIPDGSIQRGGENILAVIKSLSNSPYLVHEEEFKKGQIVFFDLLGLKMIFYSKKIGSILDVTCVILTICFLVFNFFGQDTTPEKPTFVSLTIATFGVLASWVTAIVFALIKGYTLTTLGRSLSWYNKPWFVVILYGLPAMIGLILVHKLTRCTAMKVYYRGKFHGDIGLLFERSTVYAHMLILSLLLIFVTWKGLLSSYLLTGYLLFPLIFHSLINSNMSTAKTDVNFIKNLVSFHIAAIAVPTILLIYHLFALFDVFVPIMGRQGSEIPPDLVFAVISALCVIIVTFYIISLVHIFERASLIMKVLGLLSFLAFMLSATGFVFPYSAENPVAPKRLFMQHLSRTFHNADGRVVKNDSGLWLVPLDYLGLKPVMHLPSLQAAAPVTCDGPYCGYPYFYPMWRLLKKSWYLKGPSPIPQKKKLFSFKEVKKERISDEVMRVHFKVVGPDHMTLFITPNDNHKLIAWSVTDVLPPGQPDYDGRITFYTYFAHGYYAEPWQFWLDFDISSALQKEVVSDIALATHYVHGPLSMTKFMQSVINELPSWVTEMCWVSSYDVWKITNIL